MYRSPDIGIIRRELVYKALSAQRTAHAPPYNPAVEESHLRELLDEAHAQIRLLERAIERLTALV